MTKQLFFFLCSDIPCGRDWTDHTGPKPNCKLVCERRRVMPNGDCDELRKTCGCLDVTYDDDYDKYKKKEGGNYNFGY